MNIAIIFAGGQGNRMHEYSRPKQFLEYRGKTVVTYTIEVFQRHPLIDGIIVVSLESWIPYVKQQIENNRLTKVVEVVAGGTTGQDSIYNGLECAARLYPDDTIVLLHDGVRPLVTGLTIAENIRIVKEKGNCITCVPATETFIINQDSKLAIPNRRTSMIARAPQSFMLRDVMALHRQARQDGIHDFVDTCTMMHHYGRSFETVTGSLENIKITTPADFFMFRSIMEAREEGVLFGW